MQIFSELNRGYKSVQSTREQLKKLIIRSTKDYVELGYCCTNRIKPLVLLHLIILGE
jgi:hypothetical protein